MSNILITGGAGYIGSMLATKLVLLGHKVTVIDKFLYSKNSLNHFETNVKNLRKNKSQISGRSSTEIMN